MTDSPPILVARRLEAGVISLHPLGEHHAPGEGAAVVPAEEDLLRQLRAVWADTIEIGRPVDIELTGTGDLLHVAPVPGDPGAAVCRRARRTVEHVTAEQIPPPLVAALLESTELGVLVLDDRGVIKWSTQSARRIVQRNDLSGRRLSDILTVAGTDASERAVAQAFAAASGNRAGDVDAGVEAERLVLRATAVGRTEPLLVRLSGADLAGVSGFVVVVESMLDQGVQPALDAHRATHDPITDVANQALVLDHLELALSRRKPRPRTVSVLVVDVGLQRAPGATRFTGGLLSEVAHRLRSSARVGDTVGRLDNGMFSLVLDDVGDPRHAAAFAVRVSEQIAAAMELEGGMLHLDPAIGIAIADDAVTAQQLIGRALAACDMAASRSGTTFEFWDLRSAELARNRLRIEREVEDAVRTDALRVLYQPLAGAFTGVATGVEALLRTTESIAGLESSADLIAVAADLALLGEVSSHVFDAVVADLMMWQAGPVPRSDWRVWINVTGAELLDGGLAGRVHDGLRRSGLGADRIGLEVDERAVAEAPAECLAAMQRLHHVGIPLSMDRFGVGGLPAGWLAQLPLQLVKFDAGLLAQLAEAGPSGTAMLTAMVAMVRACGFGSVAHGIESRAQLVTARFAGADLVQGRLIGQPVAAEHLHAELLGMS